MLSSTPDARVTHVHTAWFVNCGSPNGSRSVKVPFLMRRGHTGLIKCLNCTATPRVDPALTFCAKARPCADALHEEGIYRKHKRLNCEIEGPERKALRKLLSTAQHVDV